ncbi:MAG: penicillin acylase family protein, partial [Flavobacteriaceae bacterium]
LLLAIAGLVIIALFIFVQLLKPDYNGKKTLAQLNGTVEVYFDSYGIPHIYAQEDTDAFRALGYVHAQDRLWQMEVLRRVATGGLSEVFGPDLVNTDRFFLSLGIDDATEATVASLDPNTEMVKLAQAYLDGINDFVLEGPTPIEFYLTGIEKTPFTLKDIYNAVGYTAFSFAMAHKTDPLLTEIKNKLGPEYLQDLAIDVDTNTVWIKNYPKTSLDVPENTLAASVHGALEKLPVPLFEGSNSWVIGPSKTKNGKVILANDPHIGFDQPTVWYEAHISTPTYEKYGYHLAGVPFPLLGHDRNLAYGLTMFENDDVDFYYEETHPTDSTQYKTPAGWNNYEYIAKTIKVKDGEDVPFTYKKTSHGPVLNGIANQIKGEMPLSMSWMYTKKENKVMHALFQICKATDLKEFRAALPNIHAPGLNVMYGDAKGNVAWWATAQLYQMPDSTHTKLILNGSAGEEEPLRFLEFSENPQAINPPWNYVYSANNQPDSISGMLYPGYYLPENRAKRIVQLLDPKDDWDKEAVSKMITDVTSSVNPQIVKDLARAADVTELTDSQIKLLDALSAWEGSYPVESVVATAYHRWIYFLLKNTFEDELGQELFTQLLATHFHKRLIAPMAANPNSIWWDKVDTERTVEKQQDIVNISLIEALESLKRDLGQDPGQWQWGKVHTLEHDHPIGQVDALRAFFNVGPFPVHGSREVINNMAFTYTPDGLYKVGSGPSTRRIIDFSDIENSISILPTGQSGNPFSRHYEDQAEMYLKGEFRKMMMNKEEIISSSKSKLTFTPNSRN